MHYYCEKCKKVWNYPLEFCIFCGSTLNISDSSDYKVIGFTEVNVPSIASESVPYYVYLLENDNNKLIQKSSKKYELGDLFEVDVIPSNPLKVGIIGSGLLGSQLAEYILQFGNPTILKTRCKDRKMQIHSRIQTHLSKRNTGEKLEHFLSNLTITTNYSDLSECDIVIEAIVENTYLKKKVFSHLSEVCKETTIFATNTSSLSIDMLANASGRPERFIGMHFFNPVHKMDLVEVVVGDQTSPETRDKTIQFAVNLNKKPVIVKNSPGFVVNRYLLPQINEAIRMFEEGIATKEDIDSAIKLGLNNPMGPFELADMIGLDVCLSILEVLAEGFGDKFKPSQLLYEMVIRGKLGYKAGEGFYKY